MNPTEADILADWTVRHGDPHQIIDRVETHKSGPVRWFTKLVWAYFKDGDGHFEVNTTTGEVTIHKSPDDRDIEYQQPGDDLAEPHVGSDPALRRAWRTKR